MPVTLAEAQMCPNHLIAKLGDDQLPALLPHLDLVQLNLKDVVYERRKPISHVYFPCTCGISNLVYLENGAAVEVGTVGNEGMGGVELLLGASVAIETAVCQIAGKSLRMKARDFVEATGGGRTCVTWWNAISRVTSRSSRSRLPATDCTRLKCVLHVGC